MKSIDQAHEEFKKIAKDAHENLSKLDNEASTRFQLIDDILKNVLNWDKWDVEPESSVPDGYVDYLLKSEGRARFVVEAKKAGIKLIDSNSKKFQPLKLSGASLKPAKDGLIQAMNYCMFNGVNLACLTSGVTWLGFIANRGDGQPVLEASKAAVFPNLQSIDENFSLFFELFEKQNVVQRNYQPYFNEIEGKKIVSTAKLYTPIADTRVRLLQATELASELHTVFEEYFNEISNENDKEMIKECFVETKESKNADKSMQKITRDLISQIRTETSKKLKGEIKKAIETGRGEVVLIVGKKGAGKSTFIDRFFNDVLAKSVRDKCLYLNIDLASFSGDGSIQTWITKEIKSKIFKEFYDDKNPEYNELQGIFFKDYERWRTGEYEPLYKKDKDQFKIDFGKYMDQESQKNPYDYVLRLLEHSVTSRNRMPCIIFDNADQFPHQIQEELFQYAEALRRKLSIVFVIMPITDKTAWQYTKDGPLETYKSKSFYLPVPATKEVFKKRIDYLKYKVDKADKKSGLFTTPNGFKVSIQNVNAFAKCIEKVFIEKEYISRLLGGLSNYNIRDCLELAHKAISSPHLMVEDLINAYLFDKKLVVKSTKVKRAIMLDEYSYYKKQKKSAVFNLFEIDRKHLVSPLLNASILTLLLGLAHSAKDDVKEAYISLDDVEAYFEPMGIAGNDTRRSVRNLLNWGLIETYDPTNEKLESGNEIAITHSGKLHLEMMTRDDIYVCQMALRTEIRCEETAGNIREAYFKPKHEDFRDWKEIKRLFIEYCLEEDQRFVSLPSHEDYEGQNRLRNDLSHDYLLHDEAKKTAA